jgi:sugar phosphate isomerase/epimerase
MHRRPFLATLAAAGAGLAALGGLAACGAPAPANQGRRLSRIGLQLYTVRELLAADFDGTLAQVAAIGYDEVELAGYHGRSPSEVATSLQQHGLGAPSSHVDFPADNGAWQRTLDAASAAGHDFVVIPWLPAEARATLDDWRRIADRLNELGSATTNNGLRLAYHNHDFEFTPVDGTIPYDVLLGGTDPGLVGFELDVYWMTKAGHDVVAYLDGHAGRYVMTHLKDAGGAPLHRMRDVGRGRIDFRRVLAAADDAGVSHHFVEHDDPGDAIDSIRASHAYLNELTY